MNYGVYGRRPLDDETYRAKRMGQDVGVLQAFREWFVHIFIAHIFSINLHNK